MKVQKPYLQEKHVQNVNRKYETLQGKRALLQTWEELEQKNGYEEERHKIVLNLRHQIRNLVTQLKAMDTLQDF